MAFKPLRPTSGGSTAVLAVQLQVCARVFVPSQSCLAGARHFTFIYEAPTSPPGSFEIENYATTRFSEWFYRRRSFVNEMEIGITEHFQASIYFANWNYTRTSGRSWRALRQFASIELIYNLTNPVADPIGISLYQEISGGRRAFESETKLIAQKELPARSFSLITSPWKRNGKMKVCANITVRSNKLSAPATN